MRRAYYRIRITLGGIDRALSRVLRFVSRAYDVSFRRPLGESRVLALDCYCARIISAVNLEEMRNVFGCSVSVFDSLN